MVIKEIESLCQLKCPLGNDGWLKRTDRAANDFIKPRCQIDERPEIISRLTAEQFVNALTRHLADSRRIRRNARVCEFAEDRVAAHD